MKIELTLKERHVEKNGYRQGRGLAEVECASVGQTKECFKFSEEPPQQRSAAGFCCAPAGWSLQTPPPPVNETQHGCRLDGNKQWADKCLTE